MIVGILSIFIISIVLCWRWSSSAYLRNGRCENVCIAPSAREAQADPIYCVSIHASDFVKLSYQPKFRTITRVLVLWLHGFCCSSSQEYLVLFTWSYSFQEVVGIVRVLFEGPMVGYFKKEAATLFRDAKVVESFYAKHFPKAMKHLDDQGEPDRWPSYNITRDFRRDVLIEVAGCLEPPLPSLFVSFPIL